MRLAVGVIGTGVMEAEHARILRAKGTIELAPPTRTLINRACIHGFRFPPDWLPRFAQAYRDRMQAWVNTRIRPAAQRGASVL
jgi:hypothetical protein